MHLSVLLALLLLEVRHHCQIIKERLQVFPLVLLPVRIFSSVYIVACIRGETSLCADRTSVLRHHFSERIRVLTRAIDNARQERGH